MADIRVKPTKRTPLWVWVLVALLLIAAAVGLFLVYRPDANPASLILLPL